MTKEWNNNELFERQVADLLAKGVTASIGMSNFYFEHAFVIPLRARISPMVLYRECVVALVLVIPETLLSLYRQMYYVIIQGKRGSVHSTLENGVTTFCGRGIPEAPQRPYVITNVMMHGNNAAARYAARSDQRLVAAQELVAILRVKPDLLEEEKIMIAGSSHARARGGSGNVVHVRRDNDAIVLSGAHLPFSGAAEHWVTCSSHVIV